jgi:hypothetical protein
MSGGSKRMKGAFFHGGIQFDLEIWKFGDLVIR